MLRLNLTEADVVYVCASVDDGPAVVAGSFETTCAECDRPIWRAPGRPLVKLGDNGELLLVPGFTPAPTALLCIRCAKMHLELATGTRFG